MALAATQTSPTRTCRPATVRKIVAPGVTASKPRVARTGAERQRHYRHRPRKKRLSGWPDGTCRNARPRRPRIRATSGTSRVEFPSGSRASPDESADEPRAIDHRARRSPSPSCHQVHWPRRNPDRVDLSSCALHAKRARGLGWGITRMGKLNNAVAATAIGAFLRRLRKQGRSPDRWEAEQTVRAMAFLKSGQYRKAIDHVGKARLPPSKRDPAAVRAIEKAAAGHVMPSLAALQTILEEICDEFGGLPPRG